MTFFKKIALLTLYSALTLNVASAMQRENLSQEEIRQRGVISIDTLCPLNLPSVAQMLPVISPTNLVTVLRDTETPQFLFYNTANKALERRLIAAPTEVQETIPVVFPEGQLFLGTYSTQSGKILVQTGKRPFQKPLAYDTAIDHKLFLLTPEGTLQEITRPHWPVTYLHGIHGDEIILECDFGAHEVSGAPIRPAKYIRYNLTSGVETLIAELDDDIAIQFDHRSGEPTHALRTTQDGSTELLTITGNVDGKLEFQSAYAVPKGAKIDDYKPATPEPGTSALYFRRAVGPEGFLKPFKHVTSTEDESAHTTQIFPHIRADFKQTIEIQPGLYLYTRYESGRKVLRFHTMDPQNERYATFIRAWENLQAKHDIEAPQSTLFPGPMGHLELLYAEGEAAFRGKIVLPFLRTSPTTPAEYFFHVLDLDAFSALSASGASAEEIAAQTHQVTRLPLKKFSEALHAKLRAPEVVQIPSEDAKLGGAFSMESFFTPANPAMVEGDKAPLFVHIHGGPHARTKLHLDPIAQYFQSHGVSVLDPQFPGSTGYGRRYRDASDGAWAETSTHILRAIEWAIREKNIDPRRIIVGGASYGATTAMQFLAQHPGVALGAVALNGVYNLEKDMERLGTVGRAVWAKQMGSSPEKRLENSVYRYLHNIQGWVLLFAGTKDPVCLSSQSEELLDALDQAGKDAYLSTFEGRQHGLEWSAEAAPTAEEAGFYDMGAWRFMASKVMEKLEPLGVRHEDMSHPFPGEPAAHGVRERHTAASTTARARSALSVAAQAGVEAEAASASVQASSERPAPAPQACHLPAYY